VETGTSSGDRDYLGRQAESDRECGAWDYLRIQGQSAGSGIIQEYRDSQKRLVVSA
jgi:hypothetical protein